MTYIYFVRHAEPVHSWEEDRTRPLTMEGFEDIKKVTEIFTNLKVDCYLSSPYKRSFDTIKDSAKLISMDILMDERFREREKGLKGNDFGMIQKRWSDFDFHEEGGESLNMVQNRNIEALLEVLNIHRGKNVIIGTHGTALSTILNYFEPTYCCDDFLRIINYMPYIIRLEFDGINYVGKEELLTVEKEFKSEIYQFLIDGNVKYGTNKDDMCKSVIGCDKNIIKENVIIAPWWEPDKYDTSVQAEMIVDGSVKVWEFSIEDKNYTYIKTGIGASVCTDVILALGCTKCKNIIFLGSVGSLSEEINIGDIVIPRFSICGDGVCKYLSKNIDVNCFGERNYPNEDMFNKVTDSTNKICSSNRVKWHIADNFSVDTIFAQFAHLDNILSMGAQVIEMETSAAFKAANISGISICAIFIVSDNSMLKKSLYSGRTEEEHMHRGEVRRKIIPQIIYQVF